MTKLKKVLLALVAGAALSGCAGTAVQSDRAADVGPWPAPTTTKADG